MGPRHLNTIKSGAFGEAKSPSKSPASKKASPTFKMKPILGISIGTKIDTAKIGKLIRHQKSQSMQ